MSRANPRFRRANNPLPAPAGNVYQANVLFSQNSQAFICTLYYQDNKAIGVSVNTAALAAAILANLATFQPIFTPLVSILGVTVRNLNNPLVPSVTSLLGTPLLGTTAGASGGTILAATIDRLTNVRGQAGRGHVNLGPVPEVWISGDGTSLTAGGPAGYQTWATAWLLTNINAGGSTFTPVLVSRGLRTQTPKLLGVAPIVQGQVRLVLGTVRRRKLGRGK